MQALTGRTSSPTVRPLPRVLRALSLASLLAGCEVPEAGSPGGAEGSSESTTQPLLYQSANLWVERNIPVCWVTAGSNYDQPKEWVKQALKGQRSWEYATNVNFTGWGACGADDPGIRISIVETGGPGVSGWLGQQGGRSNMTLDFGQFVNALVFRCSASPALDREQCIKATAIHEFGHSLGLAHEQQRPDRTCGEDDGQLTGNKQWGPFDSGSIMITDQACGFVRDLSAWDRRGIEWLYGQNYRNDWKLSDLDGDSRADLICNDLGKLDIDYADAAGAFAATDFRQNPAWCPPTVGKLVKGDFNGDGWTDLVCHKPNGARYIENNDLSGRFQGVTDALDLNPWCNHPGAMLFVGKFNSDTRDDLLCHDRLTGRKWIDYASASGRLDGTDWELNTNWCSHPSARVHIGDFNNDTRDDLLCHDRDTGRMWIDYADANGRFGGTDWERDAQWCGHQSGAIYVGDFNGDSASDLLCHDELNGKKWIDYASSGQFNGTDWESAANWCGHSTGRLFIGDFDRDGMDDMLCHDLRNGNKWIDFKRNGFASNDWFSSAGWCRHDDAKLH